MCGLVSQLKLSVCLSWLALLLPPRLWPKGFPPEKVTNSSSLCGTSEFIQPLPCRWLLLCQRNLHLTVVRPVSCRLITMGGPPLQSLVKYDTPSLLTTKDKSKKGAKGGKKLPPVETKQPLTQTEDILNSILPPRCAQRTNQAATVLGAGGYERQPQSAASLGEALPAFFSRARAEEARAHTALHPA